MERSDIWYHLYPLGFLNAEERNPEPGAVGDPFSHRLQDLMAWLDYFVELGVTGLLLGPVFESETHGYDVVDPFRIDRRLGSEADLVQLIDACRQRSLQVALDLVLHHVGRGHPYFQDILTHGRASARSGWFLIDFDRPGYDGFSYANFEGHGELVKLNHANDQVLEWAVNVARYWLASRCRRLPIGRGVRYPGQFPGGFCEAIARPAA